VFVGEAEHRKPALLQVGLPIPVVLHLSLMGRPVDLDHQLEWVAVEVGDERADHLLATEAVTQLEPITAKVSPELRLRDRQGAAKLLRPSQKLG
jgi:hypothetical protein